MNIFGSNYSEIGSLSENLVLNTAGKVKIRFGSKFIDVLNEKGELNVKIPKVVTKLESLDEIKQDGFYLINDSLYLKFVKEIIQISSKNDIGYIEYTNEQQLLEKEIKTAQKNIGLSLDSISNIPIKEGIIFVGNTIYKVSSGKASEYLQEPLKSINTLNNNPNQDNNTVVWKNSQWKYLPIITKEYFEQYMEQITQTLQRLQEEIEFKNQSNTFEKLQYSGGIYSISNFNLVFNKNEDGDLLSLKGLQVSTIPKLNISNQDLLIITTTAKKLTSNDLENSDYEEIEFNFYLKKGEENLVFVNNTFENIVEYQIVKYSKDYDYIIINDGTNNIKLSNFSSTLFLNKKIFLKQETTIPNKFKLDYSNSQIAFEETIEENNQKKTIPHIVIGDLDDTQGIYSNPIKSFRTYKGSSDKQFKTGLYCDQPVFSGGEFRGKWPIENIDYMSTEENYLQDYPRYSEKLNQNMVYINPQTYKCKYDVNNADFPKGFKKVIPSIEWVYRYAVPSGTIVMFHGDEQNIPKGWQICDGSNGTPDLRDKFIIGAGGNVQPETQGTRDSSGISYYSLYYIMKLKIFDI